MKKTQKPPVRPTPPAPAKKNTQPNLSFLDRMENHFSKKRRIYIITCLALATLFALLTFNVKVTEGFDDSLYIEAGYNYAKAFFSYYYTATAPLYCMFLALPIAIFGVNLIILKVCSILFFVLGIFLIYLAFKDRVPYSALFPALFLTALNSTFLYYASQTYTETFTLMIIGLVLVAWFKLDDSTKLGHSLKTKWQDYVLFGFTLFIYYLSRNVAPAAVFAVVVYFLFYKKYWAALLSAGIFGFFYIVYQKIILPVAWKGVNIADALQAQSRLMFQKDAYNPGLGQENFSGFIARFFENAKIYSSQLMDMIGLKEVTTPESHTYFVFLLGLMIVGVVYALRKKQRAVVATTLLVVGLLGATFISLHTSWRQGRLILIYLPLIATVIFYGLWMLCKMPKLKMFQWLFPLFILILLMINFGKVTKDAQKNLPVLAKNLQGDKYYGYTPDWINYFLMSEYAAANTPDSVKIGCRKAPMSFVYSGCNRFIGIWPSSIVVDTALKSENFQHEFLATQSFFLQPELEQNVRKYMKYLILSDQYYYVFDLPKEEKERILPLLQSANVPVFLEPQLIKNAVASNPSAYASDLNEMSNFLLDNHVEYIIDASLRLTPTKTGQVIGTISRFMTFLQHKYLNYYQQVHQNAPNDFEPAWLYKLDLEKIRNYESQITN